MSKIINISDNFSLSSDKYQWILHEHKEGCKTPYTTFHGKLGQVAGEVIERSLKGCESLEEIRIMLDEAKDWLTVELEEKTGGKF